MSIKIKKEDALEYHQQGQPGKIEVRPTKLLSTQYELALAYSPGVAEPCKEIAADPDSVYKYTAKCNLVGVISNGTAVLGLGNIGPEASKPVMEGKGVLFKKFAGIDVFDIEIDEEDPDEFIKIVKALEPTFGGINLEDIKAPESFKIEEELRKQMNIPIMHDDQHGTAIISAAGLLNALELVDKKIEDLKIVINGAGAASIACTNLYLSLGARLENIVMCDSKGVIRKDRENLGGNKLKFATDRDLNTLSDAIVGADMFLGLSKGDVMNQDDIKSMARDPIVFALANPDPEISYADATAAREDIIMATGRSDHPNQVNNVLGFPYIFRGALDVRAKEINEEMKLAAVKSLALLTKEPVPDMVNKAYGDKTIHFGKDYIIPKPLDPRLITTISPAVAKAAMDSGIARSPIDDWDAYELALQERIGIDSKLITRLIVRAKKDPKRIVFAEADNLKILQAAQQVIIEGIADPILLGNKNIIDQLAKENNLELGQCTILDLQDVSDKINTYAEIFFGKRKRKGMTMTRARKMMKDRTYFGAMMVETGEADALISGLTKDYPETILPALQIIGVREGVKRVAGMYVISSRKGNYFFADTTVNVNPTPEELLDIISLSKGAIEFMDYEPRIAVLSYSNFGSAQGEVPAKTRKAVEMAKEKYPDLIIEGDIQANVALDTRIQQETYPFSKLSEKGANTFIFPDLASGNIAYKLMMELGGAEALGPILLGCRKPVHVLQLGSSVRDIVNMVTLAVVDAQQYHKSMNK